MKEEERYWIVKKFVHPGQIVYKKKKFPSHFILFYELKQIIKRLIQEVNDVADVKLASQLVADETLTVYLTIFENLYYHQFILYFLHVKIKLH